MDTTDYLNRFIRNEKIIEYYKKVRDTEIIFIQDQINEIKNDKESFSFFKHLLNDEKKKKSLKKKKFCF